MSRKLYLFVSYFLVSVSPPPASRLVGFQVRLTAHVKIRESRAAAQPQPSVSSAQTADYYMSFILEVWSFWKVLVIELCTNPPLTVVARGCHHLQDNQDFFVHAVQGEERLRRRLVFECHQTSAPHNGFEGE